MRTKRVALAAAFAVAALGIASPQSAAAQVRILACEPEWAALAEEIGGEDVVADSATHASQSVHYIRARPSLIAKVRSADILFCSGAGLEVGWLPILLERGARTVVQPGQPGHIMAADHVEVLERREFVDRSMGDIHPEGNPHVHLDPDNIAALAEVLARRLGFVDPERADAYRRRLESFQARWADAAAGWRRRAEALRGMKVVVHHGAWPYLLRWAGMEQAASMEPVPGIPPTAAHLARVLETARSGGADAIVRGPHEPADASEWLAERTGLPALELPFTVGGPGADDLFSLFDATLSLLEGPEIDPDLLGILAPGLAAGLIVAAAHAPLGIEVLRRGIVFIDLAIAQVVGLAVILLGLWLEGPWIAVQAAVFGTGVAVALFFRWVERRSPDEQEAVIGSSFVVAAAVALLALADDPHGGEAVRHALSGQILFASWADILAFLPVYVLFAGLWTFAPGPRSGGGFFVLFALVVAASMQLVGIYLVFASLILPALAARAGPGYVRWRAFAAGGAAVAAGILGSAAADLPAGPFMVVCFAAAAVAMRLAFRGRTPAR